MRILVIGSGAREHALVQTLQRDPAVTEIIAAPGNPGIRERAQTMPVDATSPTAVTELAHRLEPDLVVIGPEAPLIAGVAGAVRAAGYPVFGPDPEPARLEGSKAFAKDVMACANVPTAMARKCTTEAEVQSALEGFGPPYVVKDDGLAAGKGVVVTEDRAEALAHARACLDTGLIIEEFLDGPEISLFCLADGETVVPLAPAQDFKRLLDEDQGPNTGGMGAYSPVPWAPADLTDDVVQRVALPTVQEMAKRGTPFIGLLYCGLALTSRGLRVVEFNARFGDPEAQVVLARLQTPLADVLHAAATGRLADIEPLRWDSRAAVTVVMASAGYPQAPQSGAVISGLDQAAELADVDVLHAGTALTGEPGHPRAQICTGGGRVLSVVGTGQDLAAARAAAYTGVAAIDWEGMQYRRDIAAGQ